MLLHSRGEHEPVLERKLAASERRPEDGHCQHDRGHSAEGHAEHLRSGARQLLDLGHSKASAALRNVMRGRSSLGVGIIP